MTTRVGVAVPADVLAHLVAQARAAAPRECCGLLIGEPGRVVRAHPAANLAASPARYEIAPADHFAALRMARAEGLAVVGAYHSHPAGSAAPSPTDAAEALPAFLYLIVGLGGAAPAIGLWTFTDGNFAAVGLVRTERAGATPSGGR